MEPEILSVFLASRSQDQGPQSRPPWDNMLGEEPQEGWFYLTSLKLGGSSIHHLSYTFIQHMHSESLQKLHWAK